ncbi:hypothetical protein B0H34DRAFT_677477 [Crassisporium funariophilum]|nr:hypothetical protein B0H34DRAFT_677477 [Crassisporium funariophilum]
MRPAHHKSSPFVSSNMRIQQILIAVLVSGASIAAAMPRFDSEARGLSVSARDIDMIIEIATIAVREVLEARNHDGSKADKGKKNDNPPSYKKVGHDKPPAFTQGSHPGFHSTHEPNYASNHKSPAHTQQQNGWRQ